MKFLRKITCENKMTKRMDLDALQSQWEEFAANYDTKEEAFAALKASTGHCLV